MWGVVFLFDVPQLDRPIVGDGGRRSVIRGACIVMAVAEDGPFSYCILYVQYWYNNNRAM